jgi:hypothetical protein
LGLTDPFETDPSLEFFAQQSGLCPKLTASSGGYYLSGLHKIELFIMELFKNMNYTPVVADLIMSRKQKGREGHKYILEHINRLPEKFKGKKATQLDIDEGRAFEFIATPQKHGNCTLRSQQEGDLKLAVTKYYHQHYEEAAVDDKELVKFFQDNAPYLNDYCKSSQLAQYDQGFQLLRNNKNIFTTEILNKMKPSTKRKLV